jgi:teichuronic acid biosynthesis glycosyltransferase TuaG
MTNNNNNDVISVILPTYNSQKYICKTLDSVITQSYSNLEIIVIDDCSNDDTIKLIKKYQRDDRRINIIILEKNQGAAIARNIGIDRAIGRYIAFIDSDDIWEVDKLKIQVSFMKIKSIPFSYTSYQLIDDDDNLMNISVNSKEITTYKFLLQNTIISTPSVMIDIEHFKGQKMPNLRSGQDYAYWLQLLRNGDIAYGINNILVKVRKRPNSLSRNKFKSVYQVFHIQYRLENIPFFHSIYNTFKYTINVIKRRKKAKI